MFMFCSEVIPGAEWTYCGDTELTSSNGVITSPLFPDPYPLIVRCEWHLQAAEGNTITLRYAYAYNFFFNQSSRIGSERSIQPLWQVSNYQMS